MRLPTSFDFSIDVVGEVSGEQYKGDFTFTYPTIGDRQKITNEIYNRSVDMDSFDAETTDLSETVATLKYTLKKCPEWLVNANYGLDLQDESPLLEIALKLEEFANLRLGLMEKEAND